MRGLAARAADSSANRSLPRTTSEVGRSTDPDVAVETFVFADETEDDGTARSGSGGLDLRWLQPTASSIRAFAGDDPSPS
jgi:hypothetical protein